MSDQPSPSAGAGVKPRRPRNPAIRRKRETEEDDGGEGVDERAAAAGPHAPPPSAALEDLKFLQKQRGRRTVRW